MENANSVAVADINGDESADLLYQTTGNRRELSVHLSRADGTFAPVTKTPFRSSDAALAVADFDGDGWPDIASYDPANAAVMGFLGKGTGAVGQTFSISCGQKDDQPGLMSAPDLNGDGLPDLVFSVARYVMNVQVARILVLINTSR